MTSIECLLARIAEKRAIAQAGTPGPWTRDGDREGYISSVPTGYFVVTGAITDFNYALNIEDVDAAHIVYNHPARVLAECDALERMADWVQRYEDIAAEHPNLSRVDGARNAAVMALRYAVQPYTDHPDFQEEWRV